MFLSPFLIRNRIAVCLLHHRIMFNECNAESLECGSLDTLHVVASGDGVLTPPLQNLVNHSESHAMCGTI